MKVFNVDRIASYPNGKLVPVFVGIPDDIPKWARKYVEHWDNWIRNRKHCVLSLGKNGRGLIQINGKYYNKIGRKWKN
jgi:hypothetical protein